MHVNYRAAILTNQKFEIVSEDVKENLRLWMQWYLFNLKNVYLGLAGKNCNRIDGQS